MWIAGIVQGTQVHTVQALFGSLQPVLGEAAKLLDVAHNYSLIVELVLELLSACARQMLVFLSQADASRLYQVNQLFADLNRCFFSSDVRFGIFFVLYSTHLHFYMDRLPSIEMISNQLN